MWQNGTGFARHSGTDVMTVLSIGCCWWTHPLVLNYKRRELHVRVRSVTRAPHLPLSTLITLPPVARARSLHTTAHSNSILSEESTSLVLCHKPNSDRAWDDDDSSSTWSVVGVGFLCVFFKKIISLRTACVISERPLQTLLDNCRLLRPRLAVKIDWVAGGNLARSTGKRQSSRDDTRRTNARAANKNRRSGEMYIYLFCKCDGIFLYLFFTVFVICVLVVLFLVSK